MENISVLVGKSINGTYYINHGTNNEMDKALKTLKPLVADEMKIIEFPEETINSLIDDTTEFTKTFDKLFSSNTESNVESTNKKSTNENKEEDTKEKIEFDLDDDDDLLG